MQGQLWPLRPRQRGWRRLVAAASVLAVFSGCTGACQGCRSALVLGQDRRGHVEPALRVTAARFVMAPAAVPARNRPPAFGLEIDPEVLGPDSDTPHDLVRDRLIGLRLSRETDLGAGFGLEASVLTGIGESRYRLPKGMGILTDPVDIGFRSLSVTPELALSRRADLGALSGQVVLGLGMQAARSRVTVRSALLDVSETVMTRRPYARLGLVLEEPRRGVALAGEARVYEGRAAEIGAEMRLTLPR